MAKRFLDLFDSKETSQAAALEDLEAECRALRAKLLDLKKTAR